MIASSPGNFDRGLASCFRPSEPDGYDGKRISTKSEARAEAKKNAARLSEYGHSPALEAGRATALTNLTARFGSLRVKGDCIVSFFQVKPDSCRRLDGLDYSNPTRYARLNLC